MAKPKKEKHRDLSHHLRYGSSQPAVAHVSSEDQTNSTATGTAAVIDSPIVTVEMRYVKGELLKILVMILIFGLLFAALNYLVSHTSYLDGLITRLKI